MCDRNATGHVPAMPMRGFISPSVNSGVGVTLVVKILSLRCTSRVSGSFGCYRCIGDRDRAIDSIAFNRSTTSPCCNPRPRLAYSVPLFDQGVSQKNQ